MMAKFSRQKAAIRPQNISLKATAAKRPHFAHGCSKLKEAEQKLKVKYKEFTQEPLN